MSTEPTSDTTSRWTAVAELGQSIWYDNVARPALASGHLARLVEEDKVTGGTSNPSIFSKAVLDSDLYDDELRAASAGDSDAQVFERCAVAAAPGLNPPRNREIAATPSPLRGRDRTAYYPVGMPAPAAARPRWRWA